MALLIACGNGWRFFRPGGLDSLQTRRVLTAVVYYFFLPALVLKVLWQADLGIHSLQISQLGMATIITGIALMWLYGKFFTFPPTRTGAMLLAAAFPNVTNLGLPVLEQSFGDWARAVAIQMDLFATAPLLYTVGIMIAQHYGAKESAARRSIFSFLNVPPFWAAALAVLLNLNQVPMAEWLNGVLTRLADAVVPLMLFSLGLALNWRAVHWRNAVYILPVLLIRMAIMPLFAWWLSGIIAMEGQQRAAAVLEMSMPCMVMGVVFCDRFQLDAELYAAVVAVSTVLSLLTLPFWFQFMH